MDESRKQQNSKSAQKRHMERSANLLRQDSYSSGYMGISTLTHSRWYHQQVQSTVLGRVRGDLQENIRETFAPVVAWSTVRLFLVLLLTLCWKLCTITFSSAFVQAPLSDPVWIHLPRGVHSEKGYNACLQLLKSLYGLSVAPRLWYQHLSEALHEEGFKTCANDPCLLYKDTIMVALYIDYLGIAYSNENDLKKLFSNLESKSLNLTREGTFTDFL
jgi:hypothetical protein